jgi:hypothetical protein
VPPVLSSSRALATAVALVAGLITAGGASAAGLADPVDQWLPSSADATWGYDWIDTQYSPKATRENYTVASQNGTSFQLAWTANDPDHPDKQAGRGEVDYQRTDAGLVVTNWSSSPPPPQFPVLCPSASQCANSLAGVHYQLIWGNRSPVLLEPLLRGARWNSLGGGSNDVASANRYLGMETIKVPAFPGGVMAARIESDITQAGALGDPYGSGVRTVWWVRGVGPVHIEFKHAGGELTLADLMETNQTPIAAPSDTAYLPFNRGDRMRFRWRNSRHMPKWSRQRFDVSQVVNNTARVDVKSLSGPIKLAGSYVFSTRLSGITNVSAQTKSASLAKFPALGPLGRPKDERRHFVTPFDLMTFGLNPVISAYPAAGQSWSSATNSRDYAVYGVRGGSKVIGLRTVKVPAGRFRALVVQSDLYQQGFPFGSGRRTSWFAANVGLVKLRFAHRDGSVSVVERLPQK